MEAATVQHFTLWQPSGAELIDVIQKGMKENFASSSVELVECPDLQQKPWQLSSSGISGDPALIDIGDAGNLQKPELHNVFFGLPKVAKLCGYSGENSFLGAGAVALDVTGKNGELVPNVNLQTGKNDSVAVMLDNDDKEPIYKKYNSSNTGGLANLLISQGELGKVIRVHAKKRVGDKDFIQTIREALTDRYKVQNKNIGLGGVFRVIRGSIKSHIMPGFVEEEMNLKFMREEWLRYFYADAPLVCQSTILSDDEEFGGDCRLEHTHFMSEQQQGGHYHHDVTPDTVEYEGYFICCKYFHKIRNKGCQAI